MQDTMWPYPNGRDQNVNVVTVFYVEFTIFKWIIKVLSILFTERECDRFIFMSYLQCLFYFYNVLLALQPFSFFDCFDSTLLSWIACVF